MPQEATSDFSLPWCQALFSDPTWQEPPTPSRHQPYNDTENSLVAETLWTARGVRAMQSFVKADSDHPVSLPELEPHAKLGTDAVSGPSPAREVRILISLGTGVDGIAGTCHGGMVALMLDEVMGLVAAVVFGRYDIVTAVLNVGYKRRLETPRVVLCRAWVDEVRGSQGRKLWVKGTVEDGEGGVFALGETLFVSLREKL